MKKLLEELKTLDPACYDEIARGLEQVDIEYEDDIIQGACQRAIAARKWRYVQSSHYKYEGEPIYGADIRDYDNYDITKGIADTPAKAILTTYIAARKAQP